MNEQLTLLSIIAHARSGATDYAWRLFREAGFAGVKNDPAVLTVHGRLLKDRAVASAGDERRRYYGESAAAYTKAAAANGATYPLINAATMSLLAGDHDEAARLARRVLALIQSGRDSDETPYYRAATLAEVQLLLGEVAQAKLALQDAIACAPRAFEDHASTLRQFALILEELRYPADWLDGLRPPRALHFAGHMGVSFDDAALKENIDALIKSERIGFGFGALAAGSDILIARTLLEAGAELHLILPCVPEIFRTKSVLPAGAAWADAFDSILVSADTVKITDPGASPVGPAALQLSAEVAMGGAVMQAQMLATGSLQLVVLDKSDAPGGAPGGSAWMADLWRGANRAQRMIYADGGDRAGFSPELSDEHAGSRLAAMLRIACRDEDPDSFAREVLPKLAAELPASLFTSARCMPDGAVLVLDAPEQAAKIGLQLLDSLAKSVPVTISGSYGVFSIADDPFSRSDLLYGSAADVVCELSGSTPPAAFHVTEEFAAALHAREQRRPWRTEFVGELSGNRLLAPRRVFAILP